MGVQGTVAGMSMIARDFGSVLLLMGEVRWLKS